MDSPAPSTSSPTSNLARLVRAQEWDALEDAWTEHVLGDAALEPALEALQAAADRKEIPRCLPLVREHADVLAGSGRAALAARLVGTAMLAGGSPGELARPLFRFAEEAWGGEPFFPRYAEIAGFRENSPDMRAAWRSFAKLLQISPGRVVHHAGGWGLGGIESVDAATGMVEVRFASGRADRFPLASAVEIFEVLSPDDLRALVVRDPEALERRLNDRPLEVLRWIVARAGGRVTPPALKLALGQLGVEGARYAAWWRKARKQAESSPWFELSGPSARMQVRLLDRAEDPVEGLRRQLALAGDLGQALARARALFAGGELGAGMRGAALEALEELAADPDQPRQDRLSAWILLREERGRTPAELAERLEEARRVGVPDDPSKAPAVWELLQEVPGLREQERSIDLLREVYGESWIDEVARHLPHAGPGMARGLVDALESAGRNADLVAHYAALLARPTRNPTLLVRLAEKLERAQQVPELPAPAQRAQCLLQLAVHVHRYPANDPRFARAKTRLGALLGEGSPPLLHRLLQSCDVEALRGFANLLEAGVDRSVERLFTRVAVELSPEVFRGEERPFWSIEGTWTTRAGLERRRAELVELRDVKIPANAEAIGKAASYGDLSENSEWEAAIEDQRHLTARAMELEEEVRGAELIENAGIPPDTVAPGTRVRYRELDTGREHTVRILGPWDNGDDVISYRSPIARGMLGRHPGESSTVELPTGTLSVQVLEVQPLELE